MLQRFLAYIRDNRLFDAADQILLSVSGGIDSLVLWHLFQRAGFHFAVAHCNFQLRGAESDGDEAFIRQLTENQGIKFYVKSFHTAQYAAKHHISIQMAARELRRGWMDDLMHEGPFRYYATAHHLNDAIETFLFKAIKGTGIAGLHGILPEIGRNIHPLLFATRQEISDYARENKIEWREDSSNESIKYHRNLIRHEVIPPLKKINPGLEDTFDRTFKKIRAQEAFYKETILDVVRRITGEKAGALWVNLAELKKFAGAEAILHEILQPLDFNFDQVLEISRHLDGPPGKLFHSPSHVANIDRAHLIISLQRQTLEETVTVGANDQTVRLLGKTYNFRRKQRNEVQIKTKKSMALVDATPLVFPLKIRRWRPGDWFIPLGMKGKKKLSDFMIDEKIPLNLKMDVQVVTCKENIVWVVGHRLDDRFKIQHSTQSILEISVEEHE